MKIKFADILKTLAKLTAPPPPRRHPHSGPGGMDKARRGRARAARKRQQEARAKVEARLKDERVSSGRGQQSPWGEMMHQVILRAMEPGGWYARMDVVTLTGFERNPVSGKLKEMRERGWLRREQNPDWDPKHHPSPQAIQGGETKHPQWLYQLTEAGEAERGLIADGDVEPFVAAGGSAVASANPDEYLE